MSDRLSRAKRRWRYAVIALGIAFFVWLPFEDTQVYSVLGFAGAVSALMAARYLMSAQAYRWLAELAPRGSNGLPKVLFYVMLGVLAGLGVTPLALLIMAFKSGVHGHPAFDFTPGQVTQVIQRTPIWGLGGLMLGLGVGLRI